jgi:hypothetical protein
VAAAARAGGKLQLPAIALLFDQVRRKAGVEEGKGGRRCHRLQHVHVRDVKQAVSPLLVDQLDCAEALVMDTQGCAEDRPGREAGVPVDARLEIRIVEGVAHHLTGVVPHTAADNALRRREPEPCELDRPVGGVTHELLARLIEQEDRAAFGSDVARDLDQGVAERGVDVERGGEVLAHPGDELELGPETLRAKRSVGVGGSGSGHHSYRLRQTHARRNRG